MLSLTSILSRIRQHLQNKMEKYGVIVRIELTQDHKNNGEKLTRKLSSNFQSFRLKYGFQILF